MAVYLDILKQSESSTGAVFVYKTTDGRTGELKIEKETGAISVSRPMPGDDDGLLYARASRKVSIAWKSGALPDVLVWAS